MREARPDPLQSLRLAQALEDSLGLGGLISRVLVARGYSEPQEAAHFLDDRLADYPLDPLAVPNLQQIAQALAAAIQKGRRICVYGDFDVDGLSATALLYRALCQCGAEADFFIPRRLDEGYGLTPAALERLLERQPEVVVTVDNGISAAAEVAALCAQGVEVYITDHHEPSGAVPAGVLVADAKLAAVDPAAADQCGAVVALRLVALLGGLFGQPDLWRAYIDLAALGTLADVMPLRAFNRALVLDGIERLRAGARPGITAIAAEAAIDITQIDGEKIAFNIIPRLNAAGRIGDPLDALALLVSDGQPGVAALATRLEGLNLERRRLEAEVYGQALAAAEAGGKGQNVVVVAGEGWHDGVKGIVASRLVRHYGLPSLVFSISEQEARGSGRSTPGVNLFAAVEGTAGLTSRFGGHAAAVGVTLDAQRLPELRQELDRLLDIPGPGGPAPERPVDAQVSLLDLDIQSVRELRRLEPFGQANPAPLITLPPFVMQNARAIGKEGTHLMFDVQEGEGQKAKAVWFNCPDVAKYKDCQRPVEAAFTPSVETWHGQDSVRLQVVSLNEADVAGHPEELLLKPGQAVRPAQAEALGQLAKGFSPLCIMATGMGKSLIFLSQSLRLALTEGAATLLVYPLRALLNDQDQHIRQLFQRLGVGAAVLCGQTGLDERHRVLAEFGAGRLSVLLTTPEYLLLHAAELAARRQVRFIAIDEAHHIATEALAHRPAYRGLAQLRQSFGQAQILACTATADDAACARITADLGLDALVIDRGRRPNLSVIDQRQTPDKPAALAALADGREPCLVYVDSRDAARQLCRNLRKDLGGEAATLTGFYHAGLSAPERLDIERRFRSGALSLLFSTSAFGEGIDIPGLRHVAFSTMPLSATAYAQMAGRAGRDGAPAFIHLLFNNADTARARQLLSAQAPERGDLELLYRYLKAVERASGQIGLDDAALAAGCRSAEPESLLDARQVAAGLNVFAELGLVAVSYEYPRRQIQLIPGRQAELESSCLYLEASEALLGFDRFAAWMLEADVHELEDFIQGPLLPTHFEAGFKS